MSSAEISSSKARMNRSGGSLSVMSFSGLMPGLISAGLLIQSTRFAMLLSRIPAAMVSRLPMCVRSGPKSAMLAAVPRMVWHSAQRTTNSVAPSWPSSEVGSTASDSSFWTHASNSSAVWT